MTMVLKIPQDPSTHRPVKRYKGECFTSTDSPVFLMPLTPVENVPTQVTYAAPRTCRRVSSAARERGFPPPYVRNDKENVPSRPSDGWLNNPSWIGTIFFYFRSCITHSVVSMA